MSNTTREINKITAAIISISVKLIVYALVILLLYETISRGYAFGHQVFFSEAMEEAPGTDKTVLLRDGLSVSEAAHILSEQGLIKNELAFEIQSQFYDYKEVYPGLYELNTSMTSKEILQALNTPPENADEPAPAAAPAAETAPAQTGSEAEEAETAAQIPAETEAQTQAETEAQTQAETAGETSAGESVSSDQTQAEGEPAAEETDPYAAEEDEGEGGWIEDVTTGVGP